MRCHSLPQGIFLTQGLNPGSLHGRQILYCLSHHGRSYILFTVQGHVWSMLSPEQLRTIQIFSPIRHWLMIASVFQLLSYVWLFFTPQTTARQASLSFTISQSLLKLMSIELLTPSNHLSHPLPGLSPPALNLPQHQCLFRWVGSSHQVARVLELQHQSSHEYSGLISFRKWLALERHKFLGISDLSCGWA